MSKTIELLDDYLGDEQRLTRLGERLWSRVDSSAGAHACWPWTGYSRDDGYGMIIIGSRTTAFRPVGAHRVAYLVEHRAFLGDRHVLHICDNPICCNPRHTYPGYPAENARDREARRGHLYDRRGEGGPTNKLTEEDVRDIRECLARGQSQMSIARSYGVDGTTIWKIAHRRSWANIP